MEFIGKLIAVFVLASSFALGTVFVLERGFLTDDEGEELTVSAPISDVLVEHYKKKFRNEYYNLKKEEKAEIKPMEKKHQPMWKFEYEKKN